VKKLAARAGGTGWNIRIGLHSGPVVAGVVGIRKFAFDIWGNTVNFAARMESSGVPGHVNMSERTCYLLRGLVETKARGNVKIKEGRELPMFLALRPAAMSQAAFANTYEQEFGLKLKSFPMEYGDPEVPENMTGAVSAAVGD
jgi:class 3 adenylate cyclase